ncbi:hypothetical protein QBZ16_002772 [Prototheca wickerhamii]|uniref:DUF4461 domain-containing protein n=1 Tax=Prototheca wickerhamii TaxID=3111 RepID=A0AAD9MIZ0_PROWI|nr:hypothetical protein QBZ16_002772 [Prototheca wickerhamii]
MRCAANEKSFKLLQEYLAAARSDRSPPVASPYRFHFFINSASGAAEPSAQGLQEVSVLLPPPVPRHGPGRGIARDTRKALARLLTACGIGHELGLEAAAPGRQPLREFVPLAAEALHAADAALPALRASEDAVRGALRLTRGVRAAVAPAVPATARLDLLHALVGALERVPELDLRGVPVSIRPGPSVLSAAGTVELDAAAPRPAEAWRAFFERDLDVGRCAALRDAAAHAQQLERQAAAALGVGLVVPGRRLGPQAPLYREFLLRAIASGPAEAKAPFAAVTVHVEPAGWAAGIDPEDAPGSLRLPADAADLGAPALRALLQRAEAAAEDRRRALAELAGLASLVERRLRLRKVKRDDGLDDGRYRAALQRLVRHAAELQPLLGGLSLHIGLTNRVLLSQSAICIAWDFDI